MTPPSHSSLLTNVDAAVPFVRKLRRGAPLNPDDEAILRQLTHPIRHLGARGDVLPEGSEPRYLPLILDGWACHYRMLENGKRQIISFYLPGDLCEPYGILPHFVEHPLGALTPLAWAPVSLRAIGEAARASPRIEEALWWDLLVGLAVSREYVVSIGRRSAAERMGHLFCELHLRLELVGQADQNSYDLPLSQTDLGDALGLSTVHVNRSLQELRKAGWISLRGRRLTIHDQKALREFSFFDPSYLHLGGGTAPSNAGERVARPPGTRGSS